MRGSEPQIPQRSTRIRQGDLLGLKRLADALHHRGTHSIRDISPMPQKAGDEPVRAVLFRPVRNQARQPVRKGRP